jgi:hypothetical protein
MLEIMTMNSRSRGGPTVPAIGLGCVRMSGFASGPALARRTATKSALQRRVTNSKQAAHSLKTGCYQGLSIRLSRLSVRTTCHSHSIVPGGLLVTSQVTRLMLVTSFTMQFPADLRFTSITTLSKPLSLHVRPVWARTVGSTR